MQKCTQRILSSEREYRESVPRQRDLPPRCRALQKEISKSRVPLLLEISKILPRAEVHLTKTEGDKYASNHWYPIGGTQSPLTDLKGHRTVISCLIHLCLLTPRLIPNPIINFMLSLLLKRCGCTKYFGCVGVNSHKLQVEI